MGTPTLNEDGGPRPAPGGPWRIPGSTRGPGDPSHLTSTVYTPLQTDTERPWTQGRGPEGTTYHLHEEGPGQCNGGTRNQVPQ